MSNKLKNEQSPYLLQHAENPVDWYPWGVEALEKAKKENKPIFLSIGYSTCHWCHVMAHESFEDDEVAKILNESFISIKVDREERPDIDNIYMTVCQMMTQRGGWPLTVFLTPEKKPFFSATYIPKENRFGMMGLIDLLLRIKNLWNSEQKKLIESSEQITFALQNMTNEAPGDKLSAQTFKETFNQLSNKFDNSEGGFSVAPKFPTPHNLFFLLRYFKRTNDKEALEMVERTLKKMRQGGIYDHIGYGFHRYSTDSKWFVPHFEKMAYDQALIAIAYLEIFQVTHKPEYLRTAREIFSYVLRDMTSSEGGFYSAEDADSEGEEGKFYVWSIKEIKEILEGDEANLTIHYFNITESGNFYDESTKKKTGQNILHLKLPMSEFSKKLNISEQDLQNKIEKIRQKLFNRRKKRIHPLRDDKILTDWNGLMIAAFSKASQIVNEPLYLTAAKKSVQFVFSKLKKENGRLLHRYREGKPEITAYLTDYSFLIWGLIELYEATFETFYLKSALELQKVLIEYYWDENLGGFFLTAKDAETLLTRQKEIYDGAIPSGNSIAFLNLMRLSYITGDHELEHKADILSRLFSDRIKENPLAYTQFLVAADFAFGPSYSIVIAGDKDADDTRNMIKEARSEFIPNKILIHRPTEKNSPKIDEYVNYIEMYTKINNKATAYVCMNKTCKQPTNDINSVSTLIDSKWE